MVEKVIRVFHNKGADIASEDTASEDTVGAGIVASPDTASEDTVGAVIASAGIAPAQHVSAA